MTLSELSKHKHIYKIYEATDGMFHIEKFPIIYANSAYVYFKVANKQELQHVGLQYIKDDITDLSFLNNCCNRNGLYVWNDPRVSESELDQKAKEFKRKQLERLITSKKLDIRSLKFRLEYALHELDKLESEKENV